MVPKATEECEGQSSKYALCEYTKFSKNKFNFIHCSFSMNLFIITMISNVYVLSPGQ